MNTSQDFLTPFRSIFTEYPKGLLDLVKRYGFEGKHNERGIVAPGINTAHRVITPALIKSYYAISPIVLPLK